MKTSINHLQNVLRVQVPVTVNLAELTIPVSEILRVAPGSLITLGSVRFNDLTIQSNGVSIAKGCLACDGDHVGIRITEIVGAKSTAIAKRAA